MLLAEVERDISEMLMDAAQVYEKSEVALRLRTMHLLYESVKGSGGTVGGKEAVRRAWHGSAAAARAAFPCLCRTGAGSVLAPLLERMRKSCETGRGRMPELLQ